MLMVKDNNLGVRVMLMVKDNRGPYPNRGELNGPFPYQLMYFGKHINLNLLRVFVFVIQFPELSSFTMKAFLHFVPQTEIESDDLIFLTLPPS